MRLECPRGGWSTDARWGRLYRSPVETPWVVVVGGANLDVLAHSTRAVLPGTSNPGATTLSPGGVGRNIAEALARLGTPTALVAAVGTDAFGDRVVEATSRAGVDVAAVRRIPGRTGTYTAVLDADGELVAGVADMTATELLGPDDLEAAAELIAGARLVVLDGNLAAATLDRAAEIAYAAGVPVVLEPVSVPKARLLGAMFRTERPMYLVTPNHDELEALGGLAGLHERGVEHVWVRRGSEGSLFSSGEDRTTIPALPVTEVVDVTGAGDAMLAGFCHALLAGAPPVEAAAYGQAAAALTVASAHTVRPDLTDRLVRSLLAVTEPHPSLMITDEVRDALAGGRPVVALESTIISHGMPYPQNVAMATEVEGIIRDHGAVPATIAVLGGRPRVGLSPDDLELLASDDDVAKVSVRDLGLVVARGGHGATTVAATMRLAAMAGIQVFVTGGLGGVHRGASRSFDISADLTELARTGVAVVSAGVKSILDIGLTLETLETYGVPVLVHGSDEFPSFYSRESGHAAPNRVDSAEQVAAIMRAHWALGLTSGLVIAHPIPREDEIPAEEIGGIIDQALADLDRLGIHGKDATPYLLGRIVEITDGASLSANIALVRANARLGAAIATAYAQLD